MKLAIQWILCILLVSAFSLADRVRGIEIDFVTIGHPGNPADTRDEADPHGCGLAAYEYRIGKYEISHIQWYQFVRDSGAPNLDRLTKIDYLGTGNEARIIRWMEA